MQELGYGMPGTDAINVEQVSIGFNGVSVLRDIDFALRKNEIHAIAGANGAGKSTLMKILSGVYRPSAGLLRFFGKPVELSGPLDSQNMGVAMVYQDLSLVSTLTVAQNVFLVHHPYRKGFLIDEKKSKEEVIELLKKVGAEDQISPEDFVEDLSSGQRQIVEIVKALASNPKILILDEPTASLSVKEIEGFLEIIRNLKNQGISIIYITHYLQDVFKISDHVTILRDGEVALSSKIADINLEGLIKSMVGGETVQTEWKKRGPIQANEEPVFELRNVSTAHIHDASLKVHKGEVVGIAGLLGSGRTELFDAICGIDSLTHGEMLVDNVPKKIRNTSKSVVAGIALVPENRRERGLVLDFSVQDNIVMSVLNRFKRFLLLSVRKITSHVTDKIQSLDIKAQDKSQLVRFLSGGNQQKVVVGKCLSTKSRLLLLDDPTFGVDVRSKHEIMTIIRDYVAEGNAAIFISSEFKEIAEFCDSVYVMKHGHITDYLDKKMTEEELLYQVQ